MAPAHRNMQLLLVAISIAGCLFVIKSAGTFGFSRLLVTYSLSSSNLSAAKMAVQITPKDAEAHYSYAAISALSQAPDQAVGEFEKAVALRPADYGLWSELGLLRDQIGDPAGAIAAFDEAVKGAPFYSQPRWNRGNALLRQGQYEAAFTDLSQAARSNPELIPSLIDLAWGISRGDVKLTRQLAQIDGDKMRTTFAMFLARHGKAKEAIAEFGDARNAPDSIKGELVEQLLSKGAFKEAFEIWRLGHGTAATKEQALAAIYDGGFEGLLAFGGGGFGWRVPRDLQATSILSDSSQPHTGSKNLRIEFGGNSNPALMVVSQLILVEPAKRYQINFASRSENIVTGGLPLLIASDAAGDQKRLGQSVLLAKGTSNWQIFHFEFTTRATTTAVVVSLQRESCSTSPCPIFGALSLDSLSLEQLQ